MPTNSITCTQKYAELIKRYAGRALTAVIFAHGGFIAYTFSRLSYESRESILEAVGGFVVNFPMATEYAFQFVEFASEIPEKPFNVIGIVLGLFPGIAGIGLGHDAGKLTTHNEAFVKLSEAEMLLYMLSTRAGGIMGILHELAEATINPFCATARHDRDKFYRLLFRQIVGDYPGYFLPISKEDKEADSLSAISVGYIGEEYNKPRTSSQKTYIAFDQIRKCVISPIFLLGAISTVPMWLYVAENSWNWLRSGLGDQDSLVVMTMVSNLIFYMRSGYRFPGVVLRDYLVRILKAMYNPEGRILANVARFSLGCGFFSTIAWLCWMSGAGMRTEAVEIDLDSALNGYFSFLKPVYGEIAQLYAGIFINFSAYADFFMKSMPKYGWYANFLLCTLRFIRAIDKKGPILFNNDKVDASKQEVFNLFNKRPPEKTGGYHRIREDNVRDDIDDVNGASGVNGESSKTENIEEEDTENASLYDEDLITRKIKDIGVEKLRWLVWFNREYKEPGLGETEHSIKSSSFSHHRSRRCCCSCLTV